MYLGKNPAAAAIYESLSGPPAYRERFGYPLTAIYAHRFVDRRFALIGNPAVITLFPDDRHPAKMASKLALQIGNHLPFFKQQVAVTAQLTRLVERDHLRDIQASVVPTKPVLLAVGHIDRRLEASTPARPETHPGPPLRSS